MSKKLSSITLMLLIFLGLLLPACTSATATPERPPLKVAWNLWPGYYPMAIAIEKKLFAKHGAAIEPIFYETYAAQFSDFASGQLDGVSLVLGDVLPLVTNNKAKVVLITDNSAGADQIVASSDVTTAANLRGKSIGVHLGTFGELMVRKMLEAHGLTPTEVNLVDISPEAVPNAMPETIQAGHTYEPYTSQARAKGYHVIFSSAETPGLVVDVVAFHQEVTASQPEDVRGFIAAWFEALAYWQANPDESKTLIAKATGLKPEEISTEGVKLFNLEENRHAFTHGSDTTSLYFTGQEYVNFLVSTGNLTTAPDINQLIDPSFLP